MKRSSVTIAVGFLVLGSWTSMARAVQIAAYTFLPNSSNKTSSDAELNSSANDIAFFGGTNWTDINAIQVPSNANANTIGDSITNNDYIGFTATANGGYELDLTDLTWGAWFNPPNGTHQLNMFLRSDVDGFTTDLATGSTTSNSTEPFSADLSGPAFQNLASIELRLYLYDNTDGSTLYNYLNDFILNGEVNAITSPVPEPSALTLALIGFFGLALNSRRRARKGCNTAIRCK